MTTAPTESRSRFRATPKEPPANSIISPYWASARPWIRMMPSDTLTIVPSLRASVWTSDRRSMRCLMMSLISEGFSCCIGPILRMHVRIRPPDRFAARQTRLQGVCPVRSRRPRIEPSMTVSPARMIAPPMSSGIDAAGRGRSLSKAASERSDAVERASSAGCAGRHLDVERTCSCARAALELLAISGEVQALVLREQVHEALRGLGRSSPSEEGVAISYGALTAPGRGAEHDVGHLRSPRPPRPARSMRDHLRPIVDAVVPRRLEDRLGVGPGQGRAIRHAVSVPSQLRGELVEQRRCAPARQPARGCARHRRPRAPPPVLAERPSRGSSPARSRPAPRRGCFSPSARASSFASSTIFAARCCALPR